MSVRTATLTPLLSCCPMCNCALAPLAVESRQWKFFRCKRCGYWTSRTKACKWPSFDYFDAPDYPAHSGQWTEMVVQAQRVLQHKFRLARMGPGRFLDIGCSEGTYVAAAANLGKRATGLEVDEAKALRARERNLDVRHANLMSTVGLVLEAEFVMLRHVLEHVPDFVGFVSAAAKAVVPGGVLWVECPNQAALGRMLAKRKLRGDRYLGALYPPTHVHAFEPQAFRKLGELIGFTVERICTCSPADALWFPPYQHHLPWFKALLHNTFAALGYGESVVAIYRRNCEGDTGVTARHP